MGKTMSMEQGGREPDKELYSSNALSTGRCRSSTSDQ